MKIEAPTVKSHWLVVVSLKGEKIPLGAFYDLLRANIVVSALQALGKFESIELIKY